MNIIFNRSTLFHKMSRFTIGKKPLKVQLQPLNAVFKVKTAGHNRDTSKCNQLIYSKLMQDNRDIKVSRNRDIKVSRLSHANNLIFNTLTNTMSRLCPDNLTAMYLIYRQLNKI